MDSKKLVELSKKDKVVVVLSGGQDSVTCLGLALKHAGEVCAIGFSYGQRHTVELMCAEKICREHDVPFQIFTLPALQQMSDSALIRGGEGEVSDKHHRNPNLPASFVPNRNALFLTTAHAYAQKVGANILMTGVCETDYSGYPDCRRVFIQALESTLNVGYETDIRIVTPLMHLTKAETFALAQAVDFLPTVVADSHTCYNGQRDKFHDWGYGCGTCPACKLRAEGWNEFVEEFSG